MSGNGLWFYLDGDKASNEQAIGTCRLTTTDQNNDLDESQCEGHKFAAGDSMLARWSKVTLSRVRLSFRDANEPKWHKLEQCLLGDWR